MTEMQSFRKVQKHIRVAENYVPRNYQTIGGMWTVDTWKMGETVFQIMDEGWTSRIMSPGLDAIQSGNSPVEYREGGAEQLIALAQSF